MVGNIVRSSDVDDVVVLVYRDINIGPKTGNYSDRSNVSIIAD